MSRRHSIILSSLILAALGAAYVGYWHYAADLFRTGVDTWIALRRAEGVEIRYQRVAVGGFPFALNAVVDDMVAVGGAGDLAWEGRTPSIDLVAAPWDLRRFDFVAPGTTEMIVVNIATGQRAKVTAAALAGGGAFDSRGRLRAGKLTLENVDATGSGPFLPLAARALTTSYTQLGPKSAEVSLHGFEIQLPPLPMSHLGDIVQTLTAAIVLHGPMPRAPTEPQLAAWRRDDGRIDIRFLEATWGPVTVSSSGQARLDPALQPSGTLATSTRGYREAISAAEAAGQLSARDAAQVRLMLDLLATRPENGGPPRLDVDLKVSNRKLYAGILPLADLPRITWPAE